MLTFAYRLSLSSANLSTGCEDGEGAICSLVTFRAVCVVAKSNKEHDVQQVIIDARSHLLGRLASTVAKQALLGHHVVRPRVTALTFAATIKGSKNAINSDSVACLVSGDCEM